MKQIPLTIRVNEHESFETFFVGPNAELVSRLKSASLAKEAEGAIYLWGSYGCGKSHLLRAVCHEVNRRGAVAYYLPLADLREESPLVLEGLEESALIAIDDVHLIAGDVAWEEALFHLFNRAFDKGTQMVFSARAAVAYAGFTLPDLTSRLAWGFVYHMLDLNDEERLLALQKTARQRGFELPENVAIFLLRRFARDNKTLFGILNDLDQASLAAQRKLTVPFVKQWFEDRLSGNQEVLF